MNDFINGFCGVYLSMFKIFEDLFTHINWNVIGQMSANISIGILAYFILLALIDFDLRRFK